jgi:hypothetical protein
MILVDQPAAERLARAIESDLRLHHRAEIEQARSGGPLAAELVLAIDEARRLFRRRVAPPLDGVYEQMVSARLGVALPAPAPRAAPRAPERPHADSVPADAVAWVIAQGTDEELEIARTACAHVLGGEPENVKLRGHFDALRSEKQRRARVRGAS